MRENYLLLNKIDSPKDLKKLNKKELINLSDELRQYIIEIISNNPGHFASSLSVVELSIALHFVFTSPDDKIIWDVGHQAYAHKILTGRRDQLHTIRKLGGISGYPLITESEHDAFGVGHSSTSISAGLGMAVASCLRGEKDKQTVAIIGDGAMTAGLAFEGLNNTGVERSNLLIVLNDNNMAIDPNVGALNKYLTNITLSKPYNKVKTNIWNSLKDTKIFRNFIQKINSGIKTALMRHGNLFEALNIRYFGPVDGHDVNKLIKVLNELKDIKGPKILHIITKKGKGFKSAEENQPEWHAPGLFNASTGEKITEKTNKLQAPKFQDVFGNTIVELAKENKKIVGVTPAMLSGSSLKIMMQKMPERTFDVGIAEQHAVTFSAGLSANGMIPFCNIYSTFMQRAFDQVIHDVALQKLNVVFCLDRGGLVGDDGATHHGFFDLAYMRIIPNMTVAAPMNEEELRNLMYSAQLPNKGTFTIRYPRGKGVMPDWKTPFKKIKTGEARIIKEGDDIAILSIGTVGNHVVKANKILQNDNINIAHYDMRFVKPLDEDLLHNIFKKFKSIITIEDGIINGGFGSAITEFMIKNEYKANIKYLGIPDEFIQHGTQEELYKICGYDTGSLVKTVKNILKQKSKSILI